MRGQSEPQLDVTTLRAEVDPRNLLEEVHAQLRIAGAWMSEPGIAQRCRLARSRNEVIGALIELKRQGCAEEGEPQAGRPLWRTVPGTAPEVTLRAALAAIGKETTPPAAGGAGSGLQTRTSEVHSMQTNNARGETAAALLSALSGGPLTRAELSKKTGIALNAVTSGLNKLKIKGRVRNGGHRTWALTSGEAIVPCKKKARPRHVAPPTRPSSPLVPDSSGLRWFLGSDGSVRFVERNSTIELSAEQFDTIRRAHSVIRAAAPVEA